MLICFNLYLKKLSANTQTEVPTDEEIFGQTYAKIMQSPVAMDLIQLEQAFAVAVETEVIERNRVLQELQYQYVTAPPFRYLLSFS